VRIRRHFPQKETGQQPRLHQNQPTCA
jgi:hypothetical protein